MVSVVIFSESKLTTAALDHEGATVQLKQAKIRFETNIAAAFSLHLHSDGPLQLNDVTLHIAYSLIAINHQCPHLNDGV